MGDPCLQAVSVRVLRPGASRDADREALRAFVAEVTDTDTALVRVVRRCPHCGAADHGRPSALVADRQVSVSLARTSGAVVLAVGPGPLGVDVERPSRVTAAALDVFTPGERARAVAEVFPAAGDAHRTACWAVKEAVLKRDGRGLRVDPVLVEAVLGPLRNGGDGDGHRDGDGDGDGGNDRDHDGDHDHARFAGDEQPVTVLLLDDDLVLAVAAGGVPVHVQDVRGPAAARVRPQQR